MRLVDLRRAQGALVVPCPRRDEIGGAGEDVQRREADHVEDLAIGVPAPTKVLDRVVRDRRGRREDLQREREERCDCGIGRLTGACGLHLVGRDSRGSRCRDVGIEAELAAEPLLDCDRNPLGTSRRSLERFIALLRSR
jgi:hypothetical protein